MSIWQTKKWSEMLIQSAQAEKIFKIDGIFIEKRSIGAGKFGLFVIGIDGKISKHTGDKMKLLCKTEDAVFLQIETYKFDEENKRKQGFRRSYYKKFITPYTAIIDLRKTEEDILVDMKPKGRYNIKLAEKKGIDVRVVSGNDHNIQKFYDLITETTSRDNFSGNTFEYYSNFLMYQENAKLLFAYFEGKVIAGGIFIFEKDVSIYYYGASTSDSMYRNLMAPYLLQWKAIKIAKSIGSKVYDFLGVASPSDKKSELAGVTDFKLKLTPHVVRVSTSYIWINKRYTYTLLRLVRKLKKFIK